MTSTIPNSQSQFISPPLAPDLQRRRMQLERSKMMAEQLMQSEAPQGRMVSGHFVAPSITQHLAHGLRQFMGAQTLNDLPRQAEELQRDKSRQTMEMFGFGGGAATPTSTQGAEAFPVVPSGTKPPPEMYGAALGSGSPYGLPQGGAQAFPVGQSGVQPSPEMYAQALGSGAPSGMPQSGARGPMLLPGLNEQQSILALQTMGPAAYMQTYQEQFKPTSEQRNLSFLPQDHRNQLIAAPYMNEAGKDGTQMVMGQDGRMYAVPVPGYAQTQAAQAGAVAGAQESARSEYDLVSVPDGKGGTVMMPRSQAATILGGRGPELGAGSTPGGVGASPSPTSLKALEDLNSDWVANSYRPVLDGAGAASNLKNSITAMRQIQLETGFGTEFRGAAANLLTSLGVPNADRLATDVQKFQSLAMDRLQTELIKQKGPQTEGDAERAGQTFAKLGNTPEANKFIFDFAEAKANMDIRKAAFYEAALPLARKAGDLTEVDRRWRKLQGSIWEDPILAPYKDIK